MGDDGDAVFGCDEPCKIKSNSASLTHKDGTLWDADCVLSISSLRSALSSAFSKSKLEIHWLSRFFGAGILNDSRDANVHVLIATASKV